MFRITGIYVLPSTTLAEAQNDIQAAISEFYSALGHPIPEVRIIPIMPSPAAEKPKLETGDFPYASKAA